jgi:hypothetical protein
MGKVKGLFVMVGMTLWLSAIGSPTISTANESIILNATRVLLSGPGNASEPIDLGAFLQSTQSLVNSLRDQVSSSSF